MTPQYRQSFAYALTGHALLIVAALIVSVVPGCLRPKPIDLPIDFIPLRTDLPLQRSTPTPKNPTPTPPTPDPDTAPQTPREPPKPDDPVPPPVKPPEPVPVKPLDKQPDKPLEKDPLAPAADHAKTPPKPPKPAHTNAVETAHADRVPIKIGPKITQVVRVPGPPVHALQPPRLSAAELTRALGNAGSGGGYAAPLGDTDSVPLDERQRCLILIKRALYNAWDQPAAADAGARPAELEIRFDLSGRVTGYAVTQPSGSELYDRTVLLAAKAVPRVEGLSPAFLRTYARLTIKFELQ